LNYTVIAWGAVEPNSLDLGERANCWLTIFKHRGAKKEDSRGRLRGGRMSVCGTMEEVRPCRDLYRSWRHD